jgi:DNA-binding transcriptional regulator LsrR (DeoR family)
VTRCSKSRTWRRSSKRGAISPLLGGIGSLDPSPLLRWSGSAIPESDQEALRTLGAVGDVCLRFLNAAGDHVESGLDGRVVGIDPETLLAVPRRVGVAGGTRKHSAIRAALFGGWVNVLVSDVGTASALLA